MYSPRRMPNDLPHRDFSPSRSIVLVGLMGAGKSTVGRRLAKRLGLPFADADEEIERSAGHSITEIFDRYGEAAFRAGERRVIARLIDGPVKVIATGGGAFADEATRALILERCIAVWLDADTETLVGRLGRRSHRPLLRDRDPRAALEEQAGRRNAFFAEAHLRIKSDPAPHETVVAAICSALAGMESRT
jgi:shikimate kinase